ncbi:MAG: glycosyltransferase family 2 protein [Deltaproteobacteria bacterium]|nr:glycosyltransferase family 2 protein [Deltaproteobacteria bacterium]MBW2394180.1 glycosyltransferase family 2 protein [Deltaproteobacteria bacterium]
MSREPLVSVLLPFRDAAKTVEAAVRSVLRQSEARLECIAIDDGSRDDGPGRVAALAASDSRIRLLRADRLGLVPALTRGVSACRGPFIARMDADDWMRRRRLARQLEALEANPGLGAVGCHVRIFPRETLSDGMRKYEAWLNSLETETDIHRNAFIECPIAHPTWLVRRGLLGETGYRDNEWPEDYDLLLRWREAGHRLGVVPERLHGWRDGPDRLSRRSPRYRPDRFVACKASFLARGFLAGRNDYILWGFGDTGRALSRELRGHGKHPSAIIELHPGRLGQRIHDAPVVAPEALPSLPRLPLLVSVAGAGPRAEIRAALAEMGFEEAQDFLCTA